MRLISNIDRALTEREMQGVREASLILEEYFGREMYGSIVTADRNDEEKVYGVAFSFHFVKR